jgi:hypothetical protein
VLVEGHLKHRIIALIAFILVVVVALSVLTFFNQNSKPIDFYVGVEYAYGDQVSEVKALVDKVKDYTNLFVIGSVSLTFNEAALTEACDYIYDSKLSFIVQFTGFPMYNYSTTQWMLNARATYGDKFIGIYRYDEPGGNQLDRGQFMLIKDTTNYVQTAQSYVGNLTYFSDYYLERCLQLITVCIGLITNPTTPVSSQNLWEIKAGIGILLYAEEQLMLLARIGELSLHGNMINFLILKTAGNCLMIWY